MEPGIFLHMPVQTQMHAQTDSHVQTHRGYQRHSREKRNIRRYLGKLSTHNHLVYRVLRKKSRQVLRGSGSSHENRRSFLTPELLPHGCHRTLASHGITVACSTLSLILSPALLDPGGFRCLLQPTPKAADGHTACNYHHSQASRSIPWSK